MQTEEQIPKKREFQTINKDINKVDYSLGQYKNLKFKEPDVTEQIWIKDINEFKTTISNMKNSIQNEDLQIVCDFDFTMSSFEQNGNHTDTSFGIFEQEGTALTSVEFRTKMNNLFHHYWPIEMDPFIKEEEKAKLIGEWYDKTEESYIQEKITKRSALSLLNTSNLFLRYGLNDFLNTCKDVNIPFYLISGGVQNIICSVVDGIIPNYLDSYKNLFIYSNVMEFANNETQEVNKVEIKIQSLTKDKVLLDPQIEKKKHLILIGDSLSDLSIIKNLKFNKGELLKIAFFNGKNLNDKHKIAKYQECFDVLIIGDGNFTFPEILLKYVLELIDEKNNFWKKYKQYFD